MSNNCLKESSDKNHKEEVVKLGYYLGVVGGQGHVWRSLFCFSLLNL